MLSASSPLRAGVLGYGRMGRLRRALVEYTGEAEVVAICDPAGVADPRGARVCPDLAALLDENLDLLFVCATPAVAPAATAAAIERGLHVFCEKPPARSLDELRPVAAAAARRPGLTLQYGFNHRRHRSVRMAREILAAGSLGRLVGMRGVYGRSVVGDPNDPTGGWRARPGDAGAGILLDQGIHLVDLVRLLAGPFDEVHAFVDDRTHGLALEDNAWALVRAKSGVVAQLHSSATEWRHGFHLDLTLDRGSLHLDGLVTSTGAYAPERLVVRHRGTGTPGRPVEESYGFDADPSFEEEVREFVRAIRTGEPIGDGSLADAIAVMEAIDQIYRAARR